MLKRMGRKKSSKTESPALVLKERRSVLQLNEEEDSRIITVLKPLCEFVSEFGIDEPQLFVKANSRGIADQDEDNRIRNGAARSLLASAKNPEAVLRDFDLHVWANVIKLYLKEMLKPLIPSRISDILLSRQVLTHDIHLVAMKEQIVDIPLHHRDILATLLVLLRNCVTDKKRLAHVFGGILLRLDDSLPVSPDMMLKQAKCLTVSMEILIDHCQELFPLECNNMSQSRPVVYTEHESGMYAIASYDHEPQESDELELFAGDYVEIIEQIDSNWYRGRKTFDTGEIQEGIFPSIYCTVQGSAPSAATQIAAAAANILSESKNYSACGNNIDVTAHVLHEYTANDSMEISLVVGDTIHVSVQEDPDWWYGKSVSTGKSGLFPKSYVELATHDAQLHIVEDLLFANENRRPPAAPSRSSSLKFKPLDIPSAHGNCPPNQNNKQKTYPISKERYQFCYKFFCKHAVELESGAKIVSGKVAAEFLVKSKLPRDTVARILELSDLDKDSYLVADEFVIAHHLALCISREGMPEPSVLPPYLYPKYKR